MTTRYVIADEPRPSVLSHLAVNPFWPLFAQMLVGSWIALPWFLLNGFALGSVNQRKEWLCIAGSLAGSFLLAWLTARAGSESLLGETSLRFALLGIVVVKMAMAYALYALQAGSFELWEYFGGKPRNALLVLIAGFFIRNAIFAKLSGIPVVLLLVLS
jgi:hypothetical protein